MSPRGATGRDMFRLSGIAAQVVAPGRSAAAVQAQSFSGPRWRLTADKLTFALYRDTSSILLVGWGALGVVSEGSPLTSMMTEPDSPNVAETVAFLREWLEQRESHPEAVGWQTEQFLMHRERLRSDLADLLDLDNLDDEAAIRSDVGKLLQMLASAVRGSIGD